MSDAELRALEQAWAASGSDEDQRAYLIALRRAGQLNPTAIAIASYLGDALALEFLDGGLAASAPKSGVAKFLEQLPGDDAIHLRAGLASVRHLLELDEAPPPGVRACWEAASAGNAEAARGAAISLEEVLAADPYFTPGLPLMAYAYEVAPEDALAIACLALARFVAGEENRYPSFAIGCCLGVLVPRKAAAERALRDAVRASLIPWVFERGAIPLHQDDAATTPARLQDALLRGIHLSEAEAAAVLAAAPADVARPSVPQAQAVIEAFLQARGYTLSRGSWLDATKTHKVRLQKRVVLLFEGGRGNWSKVEGTLGRKVLLTDTASQLLDLASPS